MPTRTVTFRTIAREVLDVYQAKQTRTLCEAKRHIDRLITTFGPIYARDITPQQFYSLHVKRVREKEKSQRNLNPERKYFIRVMREANQRGLNPRQFIKLPLPSTPKEPGRELDAQELKKLRAKCRCPVLKTQIEIGLSTGMRKMEILSLKLCYIDFRARAILLPPEVTKTKRGRVIPIGPRLIAILRKYLRLRMRRLRTKGWVSDYVFCHRDDPKRHQVTNKTAWTSLRKVTGISIRYHDLRHTCASIMARHNPLNLVAEILGMSEIVLRRIYAHVRMREKRKAVRVVERALAA